MDEDRIRTIVFRLLESLGKNKKSIWEYYNEMAEVEDNIREVEWRDLADTILIFDGLFAAFLSAFLVFTIPQLQPNSTDTAMNILIHISQQLSNSTTPAYAPTEFIVPPSISVVNVLFFLSLALVLIDALLAMLVKSWLQEFGRGWRKYTVANLRAQEREQRVRGLERWGLAELVALLPILIQISFLFFCIGLLVLLFPVHLISAIFFSLALVAGLTFYVFTTYVSIFDAYAPFSSPVSRGFTILINALRTTWVTVIENREVVARSRSQMNPQSHVNILERLVMTTPEAVENVPVFLELLDQPVKDPTLRPSNIEKWKHLLHTTLRLLGDPTTFSDSVAWTIARAMMFCYDGETADKQLSQRLIHRLNDLCSDHTGKHKPLNSLFAPYLGHYCGIFYSRDCVTMTRTMTSTIAYLEPSNAADEELLFMVNTIHKTMTLKQQHGSLKFFAAVLTYVSSTEQSRRSRVPLTAAVIYAMHTIKSTTEKGGIDTTRRPCILPGDILTTSGSMSMTFRHVDALDLWSDHCVGLASALLQPHTLWSGTGSAFIWKFQLPLIAALYIDSTKQPGHASAIFAKLLKLTCIPNIIMSTWGWADAYDQAKLAGYWYMAHFQEPLYQRGIQNSPFQDVGYVVMQSIQHRSEMKLSSLCLLDTSVKHLRSIASPSSNLLTRTSSANLNLRYTLPGGPIEYYPCTPSDPWVLLHLDSLFAHSSILQPEEFEMLEWADTLEQIHIARARLALYDSLQGEEQPRPDPRLLKMFLRSKDYLVCTGAFKLCLKLVTINEPSAPGDVHRTAVFIPETMGCGWIDHLIQVLCGSPDIRIRSWELLTAHFVPRWSALPPSWCHHFALAFLFSNVHPRYRHALPAYEYLAEAFKDPGEDWKIDQLQAFLFFLATILELITLGWTYQLTSFENWLSRLPDILKKKDVYAQVESILTSKKQQLMEETLAFFSELPLTYLVTDQ